MGHRAGLDDVEERKFLILPALGLGPSRTAARSRSLYRLSSPGSSVGNFTEQTPSTQPEIVLP
jgi:hypothetical protein